MDEQIPDPPLIQQILETVTGMDDRLTDLENTVREKTDYESDECAEDTGTGDIQESLSTLAQGMEIILDRLDAVENRLNDPNMVKMEEINTVLLTIILKSLNISRDELITEIVSKSLKG